MVTSATGLLRIAADYHKQLSSRFKLEILEELIFCRTSKVVWRKKKRFHCGWQYVMLFMLLPYFGLLLWPSKHFIIYLLFCLLICIISELIFTQSLAYVYSRSLRQLITNFGIARPFATQQAVQYRFQIRILRSWPFFFQRHSQGSFVLKFAKKKRNQSVRCAFVESTAHINTFHWLIKFSKTIDWYRRVASVDLQLRKPMKNEQ